MKTQLRRVLSHALLVIAGSAVITNAIWHPMTAAKVFGAVVAGLLLVFWLVRTSPIPNTESEEGGEGSEAAQEEDCLG